MTTFWRFHWADCPTFNADNAWSALWGTTRTADGTQTICVACDGTGESDIPELHRACDGDGCNACDGGYTSRCISCDGEGVNDCERGYSCFDNPESLYDYFAAPGRGEPANDDGKVIVFEGDYQGAGFDGEDLAVPTEIVKEMVWSEFIASQNQTS